VGCGVLELYALVSILNNHLKVKTIVLLSELNIAIPTGFITPNMPSDPSM